MSENVLVKAVESGLTIGSSAIGSIITNLIATVFLRRNTSVAELEKLKARKFVEVVDKLVEDGKMSYQELYKIKNFFDVAKIADNAVNDFDSKTNEDNQFDFDWFMRLFDAVGYISNEDLKKLWGQVLANEINKPKACSLRTLEMIRNMSSSEAQAFTLLCKYVVWSGYSYFIYPTGFYDVSMGYSECRNFMKKKKLDYTNSIMPLLEIGILTHDHDLAIELGGKNNLGIHNGKILCIVECEDEKGKLFQQQAYSLTRSGFELYDIIKNTPGYEIDMEYAILCFKQMKKDNPDFKITACKVSKYKNEVPCCDTIDLLAD